MHAAIVVGSRLEIRTGTECPALAGEHDRAYVAIGRRTLERREQVDAEFAGEAVQRIRAVHRDDRDSTLC
jgi:hypothetical protein